MCRSDFVDRNTDTEPKVIFMPLLKLETTVVLADDKKQALLASLSKIVAGTIGKPEQYVMVVISPAAILMSGKPGDAAFVDIRSIGGLGDYVNHQLALKIGSLLKESLGVPPDRIYLNFTDVPGGNWGWNGDTFG
jgi:phenylpyruvate tautomerase PptA (4-oxalocrotonate tautomerase family)